MAYAALAAAILAWGMEYPLMKSSTAAIGPLGTGAVMFSLASLLLGVQLACRGVFRRERLPNGRALGMMLLIGVIGLALNAAALVAICSTSVANVSTLARTDVLFSLLLATFLFRERIHWSAWLATPVMLAGICLMTGVLSVGFGGGSVGDALVLLSAFLVAVNAFIIRHTATYADPSLIGFVNTTINALGFLVVLTFRAPREEALPLLRAAFLYAPALALGGLAAIFFASYYVALRALPVWKVRLLMLLIPVVAGIAGCVWLNEVITTGQALGMMLICGGAGDVVIAKHANREQEGIPIRSVLCRLMKN